MPDRLPYQVGDTNGGQLVQVTSLPSTEPEYFYAKIDHATSGDNELVNAQTGYKIRIISLFLVTAGSVNATFESGTDNGELTGAMNYAANGGMVLGYNPAGWFETKPGESLNMILSGATSVDGGLTYIKVK